MEPVCIENMHSGISPHYVKVLGSVPYFITYGAKSSWRKAI